MGSEWTTTTVGSLCKNVTSGGTPRSSNKSYYSNEGIPWLNTKEVNFERIHRTEKFISQEGFENSAAKWIPANSVIIAMYGATAGKVATNAIPLTTNQACCNLIIDHEKADHRFVYYHLSANTNTLLELANGAAQQNLNSGTIKNFPIPFPPLPEQKAIAHILGTLDDKIELNRRMNATLEGMAQALFKSWFVDFDPVIDNALAAGNPIPDELAPRAEVRRQALANDTANREAAKPFPAAFQETESMGWIPEGWEVESIYKLISVIYGAPFKSSMFIPAGEGMPVIRIRDLKTGTPQNWTTEDHPKKKLIKTGDVVVGMDAEFRATIWPGENGYLNQRLFLARPKEGSVNNFFVQHSLAPQLEFEENTQVGTTVSHLGKKELDKFTALNPGKELLFEYSKATTPLLERLVSNHVALKTLTRLRDTLLPKLISGELRVSEAEQLTEEALT